MTSQADLVSLFLGPLEEAGIRAFDSRAYYVPPVEGLEREASRTRGGHFNLIHRDTSLRADAYVLSADPLETWAFERRLRLPVEGISISAAPPEYVIVRKLQYYRDSGPDRHLRDVASMLRLSGEQVDSDSFIHWVDRLDLREQLEAAKGYQG